MPETATGLEQALAEVAASAGLEIDPAFGDAELAATKGPFTTTEVQASGGAGLLACVAVRDTFSPSDNELGTALAAAVASSMGPGLTPAAAEPVAEAHELAARFTSPTNAVAMMAGGDLRALVVITADRRAATGGGASAAGGTVSPAAAGAPGAAAATTGGRVATPALGRFDRFVNVNLDVSVELGRTQVTLAEALRYDTGSVIELDRAAGSPVDVRVNGMLLAHGEVVLIDDEYAVRITEVFDPKAEQ
ncbi:MAG: flagellar motor switch protein FliN [Actinomycetota bacterium]